jgi:hypothetical protein
LGWVLSPSNVIQHGTLEPGFFRRPNPSLLRRLLGNQSTMVGIATRRNWKQNSGPTFRIPSDATVFSAAVWVWNGGAGRPPKSDLRNMHSRLSADSYRRPRRVPSLLVRKSLGRFQGVVEEVVMSSEFETSGQTIIIVFIMASSRVQSSCK